ncbi:MAG: nucleic acid-binding protein [Alkalinema sp. CACIAM 70d]|nr:MAG: nucleic acid-binding protein [Alkalinema sp. CACIAM 70d]
MTHRHIILDSGPLGMVTNPKASGITLDCQLWLESQLQQGSIILIPEIADYEVRRELLRVSRQRSVRQLDQLKAALEYIPITTEMILKAAELWAQIRQQGLPTADPNSLDGDVILADQTIITSQQRQQEIIIATTNVGHLSRFTIAQDWQSIN